jgi:hypothetical protein
VWACWLRKTHFKAVVMHVIEDQLTVLGTAVEPSERAMPVATLASGAHVVDAGHAEVAAFGLEG